MFCQPVILFVLLDMCEILRVDDVGAALAKPGSKGKLLGVVCGLLKETVLGCSRGS